MTSTPRPGPQSVQTRVTELPPLRARRRVTVAAAVEAVLLAAVVLAALELFTRLEDRIRFGTPMRSNFTDQADLIVSDREVGVHAKFYLLHPAVPSRATATVELPPQT